MTPDSLRRQYTYDLINMLQEIPYISNLKLQYLESTEQPTVPFLELAMHPDFPSPGTNTTSYNENNEIWAARARGPSHTFGRSVLYIEVLQATCKLYDSGGTNPPILSVVDDELVINELGRKLLSFIYFVNPKVRV